MPEGHTSTGEDLWEDVLPLLKQRMGPGTFDGVLKQSVPISYDGQKLVLAVPSDFAADIVGNDHRILIQATLQEVAHQPVEIETKIVRREHNFDESPPEPAVEEPPSEEETMDTLLERAHLNHRYNFENFVVADCNRFAHAAAKQVSRSPGKTYNPLFIHSKVGLGKTHLMQAIGNMVLKGDHDATVVYISAEHFVNELISAIRDNRTANFRRKYRQVDVLLMDDIQFIAAIDGPTSEEEFFHTFNTIYESDKQLVIACDAPPRQLQSLSPRVRSRLEAGIVADLRCPDVETRVAILEKKAEAEDIQLPREVLEFVAKKIESNIRVLEGALLKICAAVSLDGVDPTIEKVEEIIADYSTDGRERNVTLDEIVDFVSAQMDIPKQAVLGPKRSKDIVWPRQVAVYLTRELTDHSLVDIGKFYGGRDHSTILYAYNKVSDLIAEDEKVMWLINNFKNALQQP
ncbi:MAG: chromosomal replication initiator protein DnaA [Armatimonadota bacterium]